MKKRKIALLMAVFVLAVTGCGQKKAADNDEIKGKIIQSSESVQDKEPRSDDAKTAESTNVESDDAFSIGSLSDSYYENEYFGIRYIPAEDMTLKDEAYIKQVNSRILSVLDDSAVKKSLQNGNFVTIVYASNTDETKTFNIGTQSMTAIQNAVPVETLIDGSLAQTKKTLEGMANFDSLEVKRGTAIFLGEECPCMEVIASLNGIGFYEKEVILRKGDYALFITAGAFGDSELPQKILDDVTLIQ